ncbi:MAG: hypothetical protein JNJ48_01645 [Phycisphaerae bacterium]|nr:hypothetical protein [Phycisphaerae bacterium]
MTRHGLHAPFTRNVLALVALGVALALSAVLASAQPAPPPAPAAAPASVPPPPRFEALDVFVDSANRPLAAWQVELTASVPGGQVRIVGIEGGQHPAFNRPPYYDPLALTQNRVILAALSIDPPADLPTGRTRVARVHLHITGSRAPVSASLSFVDAADHTAARFVAPVSLQPADVPPPEKRP